MRIDLNCDLGEGFGIYRWGNDREVLKYITSANIACGCHAGDPLVMAETVELAAAAGVAVGAHPGYPDLQGFGRRAMAYSPTEVYHYVLYQLGALAGIAKAKGTRVAHVKPHGALYNQAAADIGLAKAVARAVRDFDPGLVLYGLAGSELLKAGEELGLQVAGEAFADRAYQDDGSLVSRLDPRGVLRDLKAMAAQALELVLKGRVISVNGKEVRVKADTLCIHGDTPGAWEAAREIHRALKEQGVLLSSLGRL